MFRATLRADLELRLLEERHAPVVFALVDQDRAFLRRWLPWVDSTETPDDSASFIRSALDQFAAGEAVTAGLWYQDRFAGVVGTHKINRLYRKVELGYWLGESVQGKGIMTEACRAMVTHLFAERDVNRVEICCAAGNAKSAAIPRRLGFRHEGTLREAEHSGGTFHDLLVFGMLKRDWPAS
jgi:ribosomal-protein-serine acetyltransferase